MKKYTTLTLVMIAIANICSSYPKEIEDIIIANRNKDTSKALTQLRNKAERGGKDEIVQIIDSLLIKIYDGKTVYDIGLTTPAKVYSKKSYEKLKVGERMFPGATSTWGKIPTELEECEIHKAKELTPKNNTMKIKVENSDAGAKISGKVWKRSESEPTEWTIETTDPHANAVGPPGLYFYAQADCYFDYVIVTKK